MNLATSMAARIAEKHLLEAGDAIRGCALTDEDLQLLQRVAAGFIELVKSREQANP